MASCRRQGYRHFYVRGHIIAAHHVVDIFKKVVPEALWRDVPIPRTVRWRWQKLELGTIVPKMTVQEALSAALSGPASSGATGSGAASSGPASSASSGATSSRLQATAAAAPATASVAGYLPPSLEQAHPDDKTELANLLDTVTGRNTGAKGGTGSGPPDLPSAVAAAIREDAVVEDEADSGGDDADQVKPGIAPDPPPGLVARAGAAECAGFLGQAGASHQPATASL